MNNLETSANIRTTAEKTEDAVFGILQLLRRVGPKRYTPELPVSIVLTLNDFAMGAGVLMNTNTFGPIASTICFLFRVLQLNISPESYSNAQLAFSVALGLILLVVVLMVLVGHSFWSQREPLKILGTSLRYLVLFELKWFFMGALNMLLFPIMCNPLTSMLVQYPSETCLAWPNQLLFVLALIFFPIFMFLTIAYSLVQMDLSPCPHDPYVLLNPIYPISRIVYLFLIMFNHYFISPALGQIVGSSLNLIFSAALLAIFIHYLPYQLPRSNRWQAGICATYCWISLIVWVQTQERFYRQITDTAIPTNELIDFVLLFGIIPAFMIGERIVDWRYSFVTSVTSGVLSEIRATSNSKKLEKRNMQKKSILGGDMAELDDPEKGKDKIANPRLYLPVVMQKYSKSIFMIELVGRELWYDPATKKEQLDQSTKFYETCELAFPESYYVHLLRTVYLLHNSPDQSMVSIRLEEVRKQDPSLSVRFILYKLSRAVKKKASENKSSGKGTLDLVSYVEYQKSLQEASKYNELAINAIREFWMMFLNKSVTLAQFNETSSLIEQQIRQAQDTYSVLLLKYPKAHEMLLSYSFFLELCLNDAEESERYQRKGEELRALENDQAGGGEFDEGEGEGALGLVGKQAVLTVNEEGLIESVNKSTMRMFGYNKSELMGRNIKMIVPSPWKESHNQYIDAYRHTGEANVIGTSRVIYGLHKQGHAFKIKLDLRENRSDTGERKFIGMITEIDEGEEGNVLTNSRGQIYFATEKILALTGFTAKELFGQNVTVFMPEAYAISHHTYLQRYMETGVKSSISTKGRVLPLKMKNKNTISCSIRVEEMTIGEEVYFLACMKDVTNAVSTVYIDGNGDIKNCDDPFCELFGFDKNDKGSLLGENIKIIMPSPYKDYHDLYLEHYAQVNKSTVFRAGGRVLPAVTTDGEKITIRLNVTREDDGADDNKEKMVFKGTIQRLQGKTAQEKTRPGIDEGTYITFNSSLTVIEISDNACKELGYQNSQKLYGKSMRLVIPPKQGMDFNNYWFEKSMENPSALRYFHMLTEQRYYVPATGYLDLKSKAPLYTLYFTNLKNFECYFNLNSEGRVNQFDTHYQCLFGRSGDSLVGQRLVSLLKPQRGDDFLDLENMSAMTDLIGTQPIKTHLENNTAIIIPVVIGFAASSNEEAVSDVSVKVKHREITERLSNTDYSELWNFASEDDAELNAPSVNVLVSTSAIVEEGSHGSTNKLGPKSDSRQGSRNTLKPVLKKVEPSAPKARSKAAFEDEDLIRDDEPERESKSRRPLEDGRMSKEPSVVESHKSASVASFHSEGIQSVGSRRSGTSMDSGSAIVSHNDKLQAIRSSTKEDPVLARFNTRLRIVYFVIFMTTLACTLINSIQDDGFDAVAKSIYDQVGITEAMHRSIATCREIQLTTQPQHVQSPCSWDQANNNSTLCEFLTTSDLAWEPRLKQIFRELSTLFRVSSDDFQKKYLVFRKVGDELDMFLNSWSGDFHLYLSNENRTFETPANFDSYWSILSSVQESIDFLANDTDIAGPNWAHYNFLVGNRENFASIQYDLMDLILLRLDHDTQTMLKSSLFFSLIILGVCVVMFIGIMIPAIEAVNRERAKILEMLVTIPKEFVIELVFKRFVAASTDEDESDGEDYAENEKAAGASTTSTERKQMAKIRKGAGEPTKVFIHRNWKLYWTLFAAFFVLALPNLGFSIYRYINIAKCTTVRFSALIHIVHVQKEISTTAWRALDMFTDCPDFCYEHSESKYRLKKTTDTIAKNFRELIHEESSSDGFRQVLFSYNCFSYEPSRCTDTPDPNKLVNHIHVPVGFAKKTSQGLDNFVTNIIKANRALEIASDSTKIDMNYLWFLYSSIPEEAYHGADIGLHQLLEMLRDVLFNQKMILVILYVIQLIYCVGAFSFAMRPFRRTFHDMIMHNRSVLFMIPKEVARKNKVIQKRVDQALLEVV